MNEENKAKFKAAVEDGKAKANAMMQSEFAKCKTILDMQEVYRGCVDGIQSVAAILALGFLGLGGAVEDLQPTVQAWIDESVGSLNAIYDDAAQRFVTVH